MKTTGKHYGTTYDPAWVYAQLRLALKLLKGQRYEWRGADVLDLETGEIIETPDARRLIDLILDRQDVAGQASNGS